MEREASRIQQAVPSIPLSKSRAQRYNIPSPEPLVSSSSNKKYRSPHNSPQPSQQPRRGSSQAQRTGGARRQPLTQAQVLSKDPVSGIYDKPPPGLSSSYETKDRTRLDALVMQYRMNISEQANRFQNSSSRVGQDTYFLSQELKQKQKIYAEQMQKLDAIQKLYNFKLETEKKFLGDQIIDCDAEVEVLQEELELLQFKNNELEKKFQNIDTVDRIIKERDELKQKAYDLAKQIEEEQAASISRQEYDEIVNQIKELEKLQQKLLRDNSLLKEEIIAQQRKNLAGSSQILNLGLTCKSLAGACKELGQLEELIKSIARKKEVDMPTLLRISAEEELEVGKGIQKVRFRVEQLRILASDIYAAQCGSRCITQ